MPTTGGLAVAARTSSPDNDLHGRKPPGGATPAWLREPGLRIEIEKRQSLPRRDARRLMLRQEAQHLAHAKCRADSETDLERRPVAGRISPSETRRAPDSARLGRSPALARRAFSHESGSSESSRPESEAPRVWDRQRDACRRPVILPAMPSQGRLIRHWRNSCSARGTRTDSHLDDAMRRAP